MLEGTLGTMYRALAIFTTAAVFASTACTDPEQPNGPPPCTDDFCLDTPPRIEIEPNSKVLTVLENELQIGQSTERAQWIVRSGARFPAP